MRTRVQLFMFSAVHDYIMSPGDCLVGFARADIGDQGADLQCHGELAPEWESGPSRDDVGETG